MQLQCSKEKMLPVYAYFDIGKNGYDDRFRRMILDILVGLKEEGLNGKGLKENSLKGKGLKEKGLNDERERKVGKVERNV
jgi:hypothetical protein